MHRDVAGDLGRSPTPRLSAGGGYMFLLNEGGLGGLGGQDGNQQDITGDIAFRMYGLSAEASVLWRSTQVDRDGDGEADGESETELGGAASIGYMLPWFDLEARIRYSAFRTSILSLGADDVLNEEWTGGLAYYIGGAHPFKVQLSFTRRSADFDGLTDSDLSGILALQAQL